MSLRYPSPEQMIYAYFGVSNSLLESIQETLSNTKFDDDELEVYLESALAACKKADERMKQIFIQESCCHGCRG